MSQGTVLGRIPAYYLKCLKQARDDTLHFFKLRSFGSWVRLVFPAATLLVIRVVSLGLPHAVVGLTTWLLTVAANIGWFILVYIIYLFQAPVKVDIEKALHVQKLAKQVQALEDSTRPRLEILWRAEPPFIQVIDRLSRVGIENLSTTTSVRGVYVEIAELRPTPPPFLPLRLRQMHDRPLQGSHFKETFDLAPGETQYVDVLRVVTVDNRNCPAVQHIVPGLSEIVSETITDFVIAVHAQDAPAVRSKFTVDVSSETTIVRVPS